MHETYTRYGKVTYTGGHTDNELVGIEIEINGVPVNISLEKDGFKSTVDTSGTVKLNINFEYESDALVALDAIIAAAFEAKRAIEGRHQNHARDLKAWADELKESQKRCKVCGNTENLEAHHLESKHYSPSLMLSLGNGIVLCDQCHDEFHAFCGGKKVSRYDFHKWLISKGKVASIIALTKSAIRRTTRMEEDYQREKDVLQLHEEDLNNVNLDAITLEEAMDLAKNLNMTPETLEEVERVLEYAFQVKDEKKKFPGRRILKQKTLCSEYIAKEATRILNMLKLKYSN